jgi:cardiolipin synthase
VIFTVAGLTDALDGFLARAWGQRTVLGTYLDPLADKLLLTTSFISLSYYSMIPPWITLIVLGRDLILILGFIALYILTKNLKIKPTVWSKITTCLQLGVVFQALAVHLWSVPAWLFSATLGLAAFFTLFSGIHYIIRGFKTRGKYGETSEAG